MLGKAASNPHVVNQVVDGGLCVRCGACEPACPVNILELAPDGYPYIVDEGRCPRGCVRCLKVCPGEEVDFTYLDDRLFGIRPHPQSITGVARRALVAFATDEQVRKGGTSGGFVTQILLYLLEKDIIDGALVLGSSVENGAWQPRPLIARTATEIKLAAKSKYVVAPLLQPLREIEWGGDGRYAVVALPCYVHALRRYQQVSPKLRQRIKVIVGLFCNATLEPHVLDDLCYVNGLSREDLASLDFRSGTWPGGVVATRRDGTAVKLLRLEDWKDEFNLLKLLYAPPRCNMCIDFSAEYADLAVGDPWLRDREGRYLFPDGRSTVLVRTDVGDQIVRSAAADGYIAVSEIPVKTYMVNFEKSARSKRDFVPKNIRLRKLLGLAAPEYNRPGHKGKRTTWISVVLRTVVLLLARSRWFRTLGLSVAQSKPAARWFAWNRKRKAKNFTVRYAELEQFVGEISLPHAANEERKSSASALFKSS